MIYRIEDRWGGVKFADRRYEKPEGQPDVFILCGGGSLTPRDDNVTITEVAEEAAVREFPEGTKVVIRKYGSDYNGVVTRQGTKRLDVAFRTVGGKDKVAKGLPAKECRLPQKGLV